MSSYNRFDSINSANEFKNKSLFSRTLQRITSSGMDFQDMLYRNQVGVNRFEDPRTFNDDYGSFSARIVAQELDKKSIPYLDRSANDKRRLLREYSSKDEIRDFVSSLADEIIVYNDHENFCSPSPLSNAYSQEIRDKYQEVFKRVYHRFGFNDVITAWRMAKDFLVEGYVAIEYIYDDRQSEIIGMNRLDPLTLVPAAEIGIGKLWIQYPEDPTNRRIFLDSQIAFISYSTNDEVFETSYVEGLIRPYNQMRIMQQTRIIFNIVNANIYQKFSVPTGDMSKAQGEQLMRKLMFDYYENIEFDDTLGIVTVNGSKDLKYNKQMWFANSSEGSIDMSFDSPQGHDLNNDTMLDWFYKALKRASKIPMNRFDGDNGGGNLMTDSSEMTRDEIKFHNFVQRLRAIFKEIIVKPIKMQMLIEFPEMINDEHFLNEVDIIFYSNQIFETWKKMANLEKSANIISTLQSIQNGEKQYLHTEFLIDKFLGLSEEEKSENQRYWDRDLNTNIGNDSDGMDDGGMPMGGDEPFEAQNDEIRPSGDIEPGDFGTDTSDDSDNEFQF